MEANPDMSWVSSAIPISAPASASLTCPISPDTAWRCQSTSISLTRQTQLFWLGSSTPWHFLTFSSVWIWAPPQWAGHRLERKSRASWRSTRSNLRSCSPGCAFRCAGCQSWTLACRGRKSVKAAEGYLVLSCSVRMLARLGIALMRCRGVSSRIAREASCLLFFRDWRYPAFASCHLGQTNVDWSGHVDSSLVDPCYLLTASF